MKLKQFGNVIKGFTKLALLEVRAISKEPYAIDRWNKCEPCVFRDKKKNTCQFCGCYLPAKVLLRNEECAKNNNKKWLSLSKKDHHGQS